MYIPGQQLPKEVSDMMLMALNDQTVKAELHKQIRIEIDNQAMRTYGNNPRNQSYDSLTSGDVNMQSKMAASGYDVYGRTIIGSSYNSLYNQNTYKKMKNKIKYGRSPENGYINHGSFTIA